MSCDKNNDLKATKAILVEGSHEAHFFRSLLRHLQVNGVQVLNYEGMSKLREFLEGFTKDPQFDFLQSVIVTRDADANPAGSFQSVQGSLNHYNIPVAAAPWGWGSGDNPRSTIDPKLQLRSFIMIFPNAGQIGALEEILLEASVDDPMHAEAIALIDSAVVKVPAPAPEGTPKPRPRAHPRGHWRGKAKVHALLSTFERPDLDQGKAAAEGYWDFNHQAFERIRTAVSAL